MLRYTLIFFFVAVIAAILGFGVVAGIAALIARALFIAFLVLFTASLYVGRKPSA